MGSIIREWLPPPVAEAAKNEDPARFRAIFKALGDEWHANKDLEAGQRGLETLKWVAMASGLVKERNKAQITSEDANSAVSLLLDIILTSPDVATRCRWPPVLSALLRDYRWKLTVTVPWRPLHDQLDASFLQPVSSYTGPLVKEQEKEVLMKLTRRLRRFFPPGAATEIWQQFSPDLHKLHQPEAFKALGWLALLLPTRQAAQLDGDWNQWVAEWMEAWDGVVHSSWWDSLWLTLTARLAKHDTAGAVDWGAHVPRLLTKCLWAFQVPVGTASAVPPFGRRPPDDAAHLFGGLVTKRAPRVAKLLIYLLGRAPPPPGAAQGDDVLDSLERLGALLEQYYHPSNYGRTWTGTLGLFLDRLVKHFNKRLFLEQSPKGGDIDEPQEPAPNQGTQAVAQARKPLQDDQLERIAKVILQLASKAQYSKDNDVVMKSCHALSSMAWTAPKLILPLVQERFEMALEAVTAAHQLVTGVHTLGLCVRPLLIAGFSPAAADRAMEVDEGAGISERVAAAEAVVAALNSTLPGIDANDEPKTLAVFRFYCMVLSSVGDLPDADSALPLFTEEWVEELLARIFSILSNLDSPETRSDLSANAGKANADCTSFLLNDTSMFRPMLELLFGRLPAALHTLAVKRVARFSLGSTLPSVNGETGALVSAAAYASPVEAAQQLLAPLLSQLEQELPALRRAAASGDFHISKVHEASLKWQMGLATNAVSHLGAHLIPLRPRLLKILHTLLSLPSQRLAEGASSLLSGLLQSLLMYYPLDMLEATPPLQGTFEDGVPVEAWISMDDRSDAGLSGLAPQWHIPTAEEVSFAEELLQQHLVDPAHALLAYCKGGAQEGAAGSEKEVVRVLLSRIQGALHGARSCLPDFAPEGAPLEGVSLRLHGQAGATVGSAEMRHLAAEALLAACKHGFNDPDVLARSLTVTEEILTAGYEEHSDYGALSAAMSVDEGLLHENRTATRLTQLPGKWRMRRPRWLQLNRVMIYNIWRAAEAHYRPNPTSLHPIAPISSLPRIYKELSVELLRYSMHHYKGVRDRACAGLQMVSKRYSCLSPALLPTYLCALGGLPLPSTEEVLGDMGVGQAAVPASADAGITCDFVQQLLDYSLSVSVSKSTSANMSAAEMSQEEGRVMGATAMLLSQPIWRVICRHLPPSMAMLAALLASSVHRSPNSSSTISHLFMMTTLRFLRPPCLNNPKEEEEEAVHLTLLRDHLLHLGQADSQVATHWRYALMANSLLLLLMPPQNPEQAVTLTRHFFLLMQHQLASQRTLGGMAMLYLLNPQPSWAAAGVKEAIARTTQECIAADPQWGVKLLELFSHFHPSAPSNQENNQHGRGAMQGKTRDDMLARVVGQTFIKHLEWLSGRPAPDAVSDHSFNVSHARVLKALAEAAPKEMLASVAGPLREALADGAQQQSDRPRTLAAIEGLTALAASGALFKPLGVGKPSAWEEWAQELLQSSLLAAPLDFGEAWAAGLRFAVNGLIAQKHAELPRLLQVISHPVPQGAASSAITKRLKYIGHTLAELSYMGVLGSAPPPADDAVAQAGQSFQREFLRELPALSQSVGEVVRRHVASCAVVLLASLLHEPGATGQADPMDVDFAAGSSQLAQEAQGFLAYLVHGLEEGAVAIFAEEKSAEGASGAALLQHPAVARAGTALQVISMATRGGEGLATVALAPTLLQMLPSLLKIQEMTAPELQPLALEAKSAAVLLKYVPLPASQLGSALQSLQTASKYEQWPARAAALVFAQYFWFRHNFLMDNAQAEQCQDLAVRLTRDKKLEVQELAAVTLSGMLKGLPAAASAALRSQLLAQAEALFAGKRVSGKRVIGKATEAPLADKHAVVLGLKAFVLSTPYDVPPWLPDVLMALVRAAGQPAPIKTTVKKTLGELKRTHEEAGLAEARRMLTPDQWEAIQGIASPASYFA